MCCCVFRLVHRFSFFISKAFPILVSLFHIIRYILFILISSIPQIYFNMYSQQTDNSKTSTTLLEVNRNCYILNMNFLFQCICLLPLLCCFCAYNGNSMQVKGESTFFEQQNERVNMHIHKAIFKIDNEMKQNKFLSLTVIRF